MLGKRKTAMRRTSSVSLIGSGSVNGDSSPLPDHPKEKLKSSYPSPPGSSCGSAPRQVIGFHPKVFIDEEEISSSPISPQRAASPRSRSRSSKSPSGSPRSGLGDLLAGSRPWERKEGGVGLGIVAALSGSQEEVCSEEREDVRGFSVPVGGNGGYGSRKTSPPAHGHMPSVFAPSRASPPIPIHTPHHSDLGRHSPTHCTDPNCCPTVAFGLAPPSYRQESIFIEDNVHQAVNGGGGSRHNSNASNGGPWTTRPNAHSIGAAVNWSHNDMEVDRTEIHSLVHPSAHVRQNVRPSSSFVPNFLDACHLCRRPLGEGRDIYIYRGDKAFCSPECRHLQIVNDERPEKCSAAVMKVAGGPDGRSTSQRSRVMAAGTATAAAA